MPSSIRFLGYRAKAKAPTATVAALVEMTRAAATTGRQIADVFSPPALDYWRDELGQVVSEQRPAVGAHNLSWRGASHLSILWLRLPLSSDGREVDMILGFDAVVGMTQMVTGIRAA